MPIEPNDIDHQSEPLLQSLKADLPALETLLQEADSHWGFEDPFYRLYHQSWKVMARSLTAIIQTAPPEEVSRRLSNEVYLTQLEVAIG